MEPPLLLTNAQCCSLIHVRTSKLKMCTDDEEVIEKSIRLLNKLASDTFTARIMADLDIVNNMLLHHGVGWNTLRIHKTFDTTMP